MELARLNSPYMDLNVLLSSTFFVQRLEMVSFPYSVGSTRIIPSVGEFMPGRSHLSQKAPGLFVYKAGLCRFHTAYFTLLLAGNDWNKYLLSDLN